MATDVITTIGATSSPVTPDYTSLQAWEDDLPANLVTADERHIGEVLDQGEFTGTSVLLTIGGQTTDATRSIILRCASGASFRDKAGVRSAALDYNAGNGVGLRITGGSGANVVTVQTQNVTIQGLQLRADNTTHGSNGIQFGAAVNTGLVEDCIVSVQRGGTAVQSFGTIRNSLVRITTSGTALRGVKAYGCTLIGPGGGAGTAIQVEYGLGLLKNCAVFGFATFNSGGATAAGSDYNATDLSSASTGSNNLTSLSFADQFENSSNDFRAKSTGDLQAGTPDGTNTPDDITGLTRDATTPWIGCWEVDGGGGTEYDETGSGGVTIGGSGTVSCEYNQAGAGGASVGGTGTTQCEHGQAGAGGVSVAGAGSVQATYNPEASGGVIIGGAGELEGSNVFNETGSGGVLVNGTGSVSVVLNLTGSGGATIAGTGSVQSQYNPAAAGGVSISGTGDVSAEYSVAGIAGVTLGGSGTVQALYSITGVGGVLIAGDGTVVVGPVDVLPTVFLPIRGAANLRVGLKSLTNLRVSLKGKP